MTRAIICLLPLLLLPGCATPRSAPMPVVKLNVFAVLPPAIAAEADRVGDEVAKLGRTTLAREGRTLHATLFMTDYEPGRAAEVVRVVEALAQRAGPLPVRSRGLSRTKDGWLFLDLERTPALVDLATALAEALKELRAPDQTPPSWMAHYPDKAATFARYGSPNVGAEYEPHLTLLVEAGDALSPLFAGDSRQTARPPAEGEVTAIGVGEADAKGQLTRVLATVTLGR